MVDIDALYRKWERGVTPPNLTYPALKGLYQWFLRQCELKGIDPETIDFEALVDPALTYSENKTILAEMMEAPMTEAEAEEHYEEYKGMLEKQAREKYPEIIEPLLERIAELERLEPLAKKRYKRIKELERELSETERKLEEEKAKPPEVAPVKLRILKAFREGIIDYTPGSVVETKDIDWALGLIDKGLAERVAVEVPVEVKPPPPPPTAPPEKIFRPPPRVVEVDRELERKLRDIFETTLRAGIHEEKLPGISPTRFIPEFRLELDAIKTLRTEAEMVRAVEEFAKSIVRRESRPPPPPPPLPPGWRKVENGYLTPEGEFIPEEEYPRYVAPEVVPPEVRTRFLELMKRFLPPGPERKAISLHPRDWLLSRYNMTWGEFLKLPPDEAKMLLDKYERECREGK